MGTKEPEDLFEMIPSLTRFTTISTKKVFIARPTSRFVLFATSLWSSQRLQVQERNTDVLSSSSWGNPKMFPG